MRYATWIVALSGVLCGGCRGHSAADAPAPTAPEEYGKLPRLKALPDANLRDELARITEEGGTPEQLSRMEVAEDENVAAALVGLFPEGRITSIRKESEKLFPAEKFEFNPLRLQRVMTFRNWHDAQRLEVRDALERPHCDFGIQFMAGLLADLKLIDVVRICARLEAFQAAEALSADRPAEAIEALRSMLRLATCLGAEKLVAARLEAAFLRSEAFRVLQAIAEHDRAANQHHQQLYAIVRDHMAKWPNDADAWIGDRAMGLHAYEMVRAGDLMSLLTAEDIEELSKEGSLQDFVAAAVRGVNKDQRYYLETMRKVIDGCARPYYLRTELFDTIGNELQEKRNSPDLPLVAARLLLPDIRKAHAIQAQDRANWEAWTLALALATGQQLPPYRTNPLTGEEYRLNRDGDRIEVWNFGSGQEGDNPLIVLPEPRRGDQMGSHESPESRNPI